MIKYVAFLRGINVGGHKIIKMDELKKAFEAIGFTKVKTILASGNILFETATKNEITLAKEIQKNLENTFGQKIGVIIRTIEGLKNLFNQNPFTGVKVSPQTRLYVTFLSEKPMSDLKIPYESPDKNFKIIHATTSEVCSVLTLLPNRRTVDLMSILEKEFGRQVTTRNWNTIERILKASAPS